MSVNGMIIMASTLFPTETCFAQKGVVGPKLLQYIRHPGLKVGSRVNLQGRECANGVIYLDLIFIVDNRTGECFNFHNTVMFNSRNEFQQLFMQSTKVTKALYGF